MCRGWRCAPCSREVDTLAAWPRSLSSASRCSRANPSCVCRSWPDPAWDDGNSNPHQYRAFSLPYALLWLKAQAAINNVTFSGLEYWTPNSQGTEARINMPITLQFDVGTNGWVQETYNLKDSDFCKQHDAQQARRRLRAAFNEPYADDEVVGHDYVDGRRVPIIKARRLA